MARLWDICNIWGNQVLTKTKKKTKWHWSSNATNKMFGSKFSLYECLKFNVHCSSLPMSRIRNSAAAAAFCLDWNSGAVGLRGVASWDLSHNNSRGYKCCMALSRTVFWVRTLAARTTPSRPAISFSTIPSGQQFWFGSSDLNISTSPTDRGFFEFPYFRRCRSSSARWYSEDQRRQIASLLLWRRSFSFRWYDCSSGKMLDLMNNRAFGVSVGSCMSSSA